MSIMEYALAHKRIWDEVDHYLPPDTSSLMYQHTLRFRLLGFIRGLNREYEYIRRAAMYRTEGLPTISELVKELQEEESHILKKALPRSVPTAARLVMWNPAVGRSTSLNRRRRRRQSRLCLLRLLPALLSMLRQNSLTVCRPSLLGSRPSSLLFRHPPRCPPRLSLVGRTTPIRREHGLLLLDEWGTSQCFRVQPSLRPADEQRRGRLHLTHQRLRHPSFAILKRLFPTLFVGLDPKTIVCEACQLAKHRRSSFPSSQSHTSTPLLRIHSDVWGPAPKPSLQGHRYFLIFVDEATRCTWTYLLRAKSDVSGSVRHFCAMIQTQFGRGIQRFRSDNARDFFNADLDAFFAERGILHESSCVATPEQNGMAERRIGYVTSTARTLLENYAVPWTYWGEAILTSTHLINRLPSQSLDFATPLDRLGAAFPGVPLKTGLLPRVFGCTAYVHDTSPTLTKLDAKALRCVFVGYSTLQKGYRCYHPPSRRFFVSANVTFAEYEPYFGDYSSSPRLPLDEDPSVPHLEPVPSAEPTAPTVSSSHDLSSFDPPVPSSSSLEVLPAPPIPDFDVAPSWSPPEASSSPMVDTSSPLGESLPTPDEDSFHDCSPDFPPTQASAPSSSGDGPPSSDGNDDHLGWPIALRKGVRKCTRTPLYPMSH
ncbi:uncharacterized protein LOC144708393 [Wolffia australiana]